MEECCLCSRSVGVGSSKKKRKKLYGTGCLVTRVVLERLVDELAGEGGTKKFVDAKGPHAFLCHVCEGKLQSIAKHENQLRALKAEINTLLQSALNPNTDRELAGRKRCREDGGTLNLTGKSPRLDPQPQGPTQGVSQQSPEQPELPTCSGSHDRSPPVSLEHSPTNREQPISLQQSPTISVRYICMASVNVMVLFCPSGKWYFALLLHNQSM